MLRITQNNNSGRAKSYYSAADYYTQGQELVGFWRGKGAAMLGLNGTVEQGDWDRLCDNLRPDTVEPLTVRRKAERRVGYDLNFHAPKSVSLLYGLTRDDRVLDGFRDSVRATMEDIEAEAKARVRSKGRNEDRVTGNLAWGEFTHFTARPGDGRPDPHLHAHCFAFNATYDHEESRWKAAQLGDIKRDAPYFEAVFHARLARRLEELGLATHRTAKGWELAGLDPATMEKFSRRTALIEQAARDKGITDPEAKSELGARTRSSKAAEMTMPDLESAWRSRLTDAESDRLEALAERIGRDPIAEDDTAAKEAVARTMEHVFERASVLPERTLLAEALRQGVGRSSRETIEKLTDAQDLIRAERDGQKLVTTQRVLEEESRMLAFARDGRGACRPCTAEDMAFHREWLNDQQKDAVRHVLHSRDRVTIVRGAAGAGKTSAMQEVREAASAVGVTIHAFAPSTGASRGVLRSEGFEDADTVAALLVNSKLQERVKDSLILIDEAGLVGVRTMNALFDLAEKQHARVLLVGDERQHGPVERGSALRLLEDEAGLHPAEIKAIQRQKDRYRAAIEDLSEGRTAKGFERLDELGWIREIGDEDRDDALATAYANSVESGASTLVVSPTHAEGNRITRAIRGALRERGLLGQDTRVVPELIPANLTLGQKRDPASYQTGDVLVFHQNATGHRKGERLVVGHGEVPRDLAERFTVYRQSSVELAQGDHVRITRNGRSLDDKPLNNGDLYRVRGFTPEGNVLVAGIDRRQRRNTKTIPADYGHLTHGFVVTSHASQGKTVDRVIIGQSSRSLAASSKEQFYVSASRARTQALVFTDDKHQLLDAVRRGDQRISGTELVSGLADHHRRVVLDRLTEQQREADALIAASDRNLASREGPHRDR